jgi:exopolysaccharide production protein ExoY
MIVRLQDVGRPIGQRATERVQAATECDPFQASLRKDLASCGWVVALEPRVGGWRKRALDVFGAVAGAVATAPLLLAMAVAIKLQDGGPIFYGHERIGYGGRRFQCWKFRTMATDADERLKAMLATDAAAALEWSTRRKLKNDPRVTKLGRWLRLSSIDELPQLYNVLKGEMSLVGPRPLTLAELNEMGSGKKEYLSARPGLSGLWQVSGRSNTSRADRIELDRRYVKTWSMKADIWIILKTVPAVLSRRGAY